MPKIFILDPLGGGKVHSWWIEVLAPRYASASCLKSTYCSYWPCYRPFQNHNTARPPSFCQNKDEEKHDDCYKQQQEKQHSDESRLSYKENLHSFARRQSTTIRVRRRIGLGRHWREDLSGSDSKEETRLRIRTTKGPFL